MSRSRSRLRLIGAVLTALLAAPTVAAAGSSPAPAAITTWWHPVAVATYSPLTVVHVTKIDSRLEEFELSTPYLSSPTYVRVLLPTSYAAHPKSRYPVLYLLDGCCNAAPQARDWTTAATKGNAEAATASYGLITVMPDCGEGGMYTDWWNNGAGGDPRWESYLIGQLLPWVDRTFRTDGTRQGRAIAGLSMGGFGAMSLAARHPDLFAAAVSFSGIVDSTQDPEEDEALAAIDGGTIGSLWGPYVSQEIRWRGHNPTDLVTNLRGMSLTMRTGNGVPGPLDPPVTDPSGLPGDLAGGGIEATVHAQNVAFDDALTAAKIPATYDDYGPGTHSWPYWDRDLVQTLPSLIRTLTKPDAAPLSFSDMSIESVFEDFGYVVTTHRSVVEFASIDGVTADGFSVSGSGTDGIVTASRYVPGGLYRVTMTGSTTSSRVIRADSAGRLHLTVGLGPSNTIQQDTPGADMLRHTDTAKVSIRRA